jgi:hypothetical protein
MYSWFPSFKLISMVSFFIDSTRFREFLPLFEGARKIPRTDSRAQRVRN